MSDFKEFCLIENLSPLQIIGARKAWQHQEATLQEMEEVIKLQDADLRKYEKQLEGHQFTINATVRKLSEAEKRIDAVRAIMNEYYTGSFDESPELAGLISAALEGDYAT